MKLNKRQREELRNKFGGHCAYCGCLLGERWQADHLVPVWRESKYVRSEDGLSSKIVGTGKMFSPQHDTLDNLMPSCGPCNNDKSCMTLESWRKRLADLVNNLRRNSSAHRHAVRFGQVVECPSPIVFYFEGVVAGGGVEPPPVPACGGQAKTP